MRLLTAILIAALSFGGAASAKQPLREVASIDDALMYVAIADAIRKSCDTINARLIRAYSELNRLKALARDMGYTEEEVEAYVTSKAEKARMKGASPKGLHRSRSKAKREQGMRVKCLPKAGCGARCITMKK